MHESQPRRSRTNPTQLLCILCTSIPQSNPNTPQSSTLSISPFVAAAPTRVGTPKLFSSKDNASTNPFSAKNSPTSQGRTSSPAATNQTVRCLGPFYLIHSRVTSGIWDFLPSAPINKKESLAASCWPPQKIS